jgi:hypothetical protein
MNMTPTSASDGKLQNIINQQKETAAYVYGYVEKKKKKVLEPVDVRPHRENPTTVSYAGDASRSERPCLAVYIHTYIHTYILGHL